MQRRTLVRARDLRAFRGALAHLAVHGTPQDAARRAVVVPTHAAGALLGRTIELARLSGDVRACVMPSFVTREGMMASLHAALPDEPPLLSVVERHVLFERAAMTTAARARVGRPPFALRPGLIEAMVDLYDELRRRQRSVGRFARVLFDQLRAERGTDRGSESLVHQTAFLGFAFLAYDRLARASGRLDEHGLRDRLLLTQPPLPFSHLVVAVADHPADPRGLWPADFDLVGRLAHLSRLDVVMTDETHDAGLRERLEQELPGIVESRHDTGESRPAPIIRRAPTGDGGAVGAAPAVAFVSRDREEEVRAVARAVVSRAREGAPEASTAMVFHRPLPYLYLARQVFSDARVPIQTFDALPLASEPSAALVDMALAAARTGGSRETTLALLRSPLLAFDVDGVHVGVRDVSALDAVLAARRSSTGAAGFADAVRAYFADRTTRHGVARDRAARAAVAAARLTEDLGRCLTASRGAEQVRVITAFLRRHEQEQTGDAFWRDRFARARAAVFGVLDGLAAAFERHDDRPRDSDELLAAIRHALESRTFTPPQGRAGVCLVDAVAACFAGFDHVHLVGLVESDWPERPRRSIFYTSGLLSALSWPSDTDQARARRGAFTDLLGLARATTSLHAFELEGDAVVLASPMIELARALPFEPRAIEALPVFPDETLTRAAAPIGLAPDLAGWLSDRRARPPLSDPRYAGSVGERAPAPYRVSRVDRYVDCPFKYFAESVLGLAEEREEPAGLTPLERGTLLHELFETFYREWDARHGGAITGATLPEALRLFAELAGQALGRLPGPDRVLEETRLLGSVVGRGAAGRVFELEADQGGVITGRLLEFDLKGEFEFPMLSGIRQKRIAVAGKADRIDLFDDGAIRVVDYKLGRLPDVRESVQIGVYAHCASQSLRTGDGEPRPIGAAMYLAFGDERRFEGHLGRRGERPTAEVQMAAERFARMTDGIEAGTFPPRPRRPSECGWCGFSGVCRKEYVAEDDEPTAESL